MNDAVRELVEQLLSEVDCRIEHGAESGGHLEYVRDYLRRICASDLERAVGVEAPQRVFVLGEAKVCISKGTVGEHPAVFIRPADEPGHDVGDPAPTDVAALANPHEIALVLPNKTADAVLALKIAEALGRAAPPSDERAMGERGVGCADCGAVGEAPHRAGCLYAPPSDEGRPAVACRGCGMFTGHHDDCPTLIVIPPAADEGRPTSCELHGCVRLPAGYHDIDCSLAIPPAAGGATTNAIAHKPNANMSGFKLYPAAPVGEPEQHEALCHRTIGGDKCTCIRHAALRSIESSEGAVAWICDDDTPDTTPVWEQAEEWRLAGRPVTPLFTRSAEVTEDAVNRAHIAYEQVMDAAFRGKEISGYGIGPETKRAIRAALQAALRRE